MTAAARVQERSDTQGLTSELSVLGEETIGAGEMTGGERGI